MAPGTKDDCVATEDVDILRAGLAGRAAAKEDGDAENKPGVGAVGLTADVGADDCAEDGRCDAGACTGVCAAGAPDVDAAGEGAAAAPVGML